MKRFLILGDPVDLHAHYVSWALETAGYHPSFVNCSHDESPARTTLYLDDLIDEFTTADWDDAEAAWSRRLPVPFIPSQSYGENEGFILREERSFTKWLIDMEQESSSIRWINCPTASVAAENKLIQLKSARRHGIAVPRTLITAQPERFRAFLRSEGTLVAKPLSSYTWEYESGETLTAFATILDSARGAALSDADIAQCITVYQQRIDKVADIRMVVMGQDAFAYRVIQEGEQHFDFRLGFYQKNHLKYEEIAVPPSLREKMAAFMSSLRINFASADFALKADGEFVFLDLNPNGQWLFIEAESPENLVGQKFCSFFVKGRVDPHTENLFPSFSDFLASDVAKGLRKQFQQHAEAQVGSSNTWKESAGSSPAGLAACAPALS